MTCRWLISSRRILTYKGRGLSELPKGVAASEHSVIYSSRRNPDLTEDEKVVVRSQQLAIPIQVKSRSHKQMIDPKARLRWTRTYEISFDVKAMCFAEMDQKFLPKVKHQYEKLNPGFSINISDMYLGSMDSSDFSSDEDVILIDEPIKAPEALLDATTPVRSPICSLLERLSLTLSLSGAHIREAILSR
jgi:hypothetical protein